MQQQGAGNEPNHQRNGVTVIERRNNDYSGAKRAQKSPRRCHMSLRFIQQIPKSCRGYAGRRLARAKREPGQRFFVALVFRVSNELIGDHGGLFFGEHA
jgi:hypothetical protein